MRSIFYFISLFLGCNSFHPRIPETLIVELPKAITAKIDPKDSSYLKVKLFLDNRYQIFLGRDSLSTKNIEQIDRFISKRITILNRDKVFVIGDPNARYTTFRNLKNVFKKYEIFRFRIVTETSP